MQMTKFQHKFYALSLALMELIPLPEDEERFLTAYSTQLIVWRYMLGRSLRAETTFPLDAETHLSNKTYAEARESISLTILDEIEEVQRVFFLLISEDNDGTIAFTDVVLRHWLGLIEELVASNEPDKVKILAAQKFDLLLALHARVVESFDLSQSPSYPFSESINKKSPEEISGDLDSIRSQIQSDQN